MNAYAELGVAPDADLQTIREAYTRLTRQLHALPPDDDVVARIARVNVAFQVLTAPRRDGDGPLRFAPDVTTPPDPQARPWTARPLNDGPAPEPPPDVWTARRAHTESPTSDP